MKIKINNSQLIANEAMNLICLTFSGGNYFFKHDQLDSLKELLDSRDIEDVRDLISDYKKWLSSQIDCDFCFGREYED